MTDNDKATMTELEPYFKAFEKTQVFNPPFEIMAKVHDLSIKYLGRRFASGCCGVRVRQSILELRIKHDN